MNALSLFLFEGKHLVRNPFKVIALLLFIVAAGYGLHNGARLYHDQMAEVEKIRAESTQSRAEYRAYYEAGERGPEGAPWVNMADPFWAIWFSHVYHVKAPSSSMVYSMGQAEQYGYYKRVTFRATPYDSDMTQEIANPERLQTGTLDFAFALLFLLPLLLLTLVYNLKSIESELGFLPLIEVQTPSKNRWLLSRIAFYGVLLYLVVAGLLLYGASLTDVLSSDPGSLGQMLLYSFLYLLFWLVIDYFILRSGTTIVGNTLKMVGVWLLLAFIIPAGVQQWISIQNPANLMTDFIEASRDQREEIYDLPDSVLLAQLIAIYPDIETSPATQNPNLAQEALDNSAYVLINDLLKSSVAPIEAENEAKNAAVRGSYILNPVTFFQNRFNAIAHTHYDDYQGYRKEIQRMIDKQIQTLVLDSWGATTVDGKKFDTYYQALSTP